MNQSAETSVLSVAGIQMCSTTDLRANLATAADAMARAADAGARLVVLPENVAVYGGGYRQVAERDGQMLTEWACQRARDLGIWLIAGTLPLISRPDGSEVPDGRVRAASLAINPRGEVVSRYDKLHLFDATVADAQGRYCESDSFEPGDRLALVDLDGLRVGMAVCYDLRFPELAQALALRGADLLVYPSAFTAVTGAAHWRLLLRARAVETGCYVLGVNQCGQHDPRRATYGHSLLVDPWGTVVAELNDRPSELLAGVEPDRIAEVRNRLPVLQHRRLTTGLPDDIKDS